MLTPTEKALLGASLTWLRLTVAETRERASHTDTVFVQSFMDQISDLLGRCECRLLQEGISPEARTAEAQGVKVIVRHNHRIGEQKHD